MSTTALYTGPKQPCGTRVRVVALTGLQPSGQRTYLCRDDTGEEFLAASRFLEDIRYEDDETPVVEHEGDAAKLMRLVRQTRHAAYRSGVYHADRSSETHRIYHEVLQELIDHVKATVPGADQV